MKTHTCTENKNTVADMIAILQQATQDSIVTNESGAPVSAYVDPLSGREVVIAEDDIKTMTAKEVIEKGTQGWYWWRYSEKWNWWPLSVAIFNNEWRAGGTAMDCTENPKLNRGGEYVGPINKPNIV